MLDIGNNKTNMLRVCKESTSICEDKMYEHIIVITTVRADRGLSRSPSFCGSIEK